MKRFGYASLGIGIVLMLCYAFFANTAFAAQNAGIYLNSVDKNIPVRTGQQLDIPVFVLSGDLLTKQTDVFIWIESVKDANNAPAASRYLSVNNKELIWTPFINEVQIKPLSTGLSLDSSYYNFIYSYGIAEGFKSFDLYLCLKESSGSGPIDSSVVKSQGVCGSRSVEVCSDIAVSPVLLQASAQSGKGPIHKQVSVTDCNGSPVDFNAKLADPTQGWIWPDKAQTGILDVSIDASNLSPGSYHSTIYVNSLSGSRKTVDVSLDVTAACNSILKLSPESLSSQTLTTGDKGSPVSVYVKDGCNVDAANYIATSDKSWIVIPSQATGLFYVTLDAANLTPGSYTGNIKVSNGVASKNISVTLEVKPKSNSGGTVGKPNVSFPGGSGGTCTPTLSVSWPATLTATAGQTVTTNVDVTDGCGKKPQYTTQIVSTTGGSWLTVPSSGSGPLTITAMTTGMAGGTYTGAFKVSSSGLGESTVTVTLVVTGPCTVSSVAPISPVNVSAVTGSNAASTSFNVTDNCYTNLGYTINSVTGAWISSPVSGAAGTGTVTINFMSSGLPAGSYTGYIDLTAAGYPNSVRVTVNLTVTTAPTSSNNGNAQAFPDKQVYVGGKVHLGSVSFRVGPMSAVYYYFTTAFPSSTNTMNIQMEGQTNYEPNADMLVRYAGQSCDGSLPTSADMANVLSYQQTNGVSDCSSSTLPCSPPQYRPDLYYRIVGNAFEMVSINGVGGYPKGCYYIMVYNTGNTTSNLRLSYSETTP